MTDLSQYQNHATLNSKRVYGVPKNEKKKISGSSGAVDVGKEDVKRKTNSHVRPHKKGMGNACLVKAQHDITVKYDTEEVWKFRCFLKEFRKR